MSAEKPLVYLLLGAAGSGRREVLADLIADGLEPTDRPATLLAADEPPAAFDDRLGALSRWQWTADRQIVATLPPEATHVFFMTHGRHNPVDQIEAFRAWLPGSGAELGAILTVVHCQLVAQHHALQTWYDACVHFSDVVLLNRREGIANKWMSDFLGHYKAQFLPCLFEYVKNGRVKNPVLLLEPQARRISQAFDPVEELPASAAGVVIEDETDPEDDEEAAEAAAQEAVDNGDAPPGEDPYFVRWPSGLRDKEIPDINKYLGA
ncbi:MAG: hypothetical protein HZA31_01295 [Opitutae bacterium]|nr:hypothetical protein [Opitutae bacterium]